MLLSVNQYHTLPTGGVKAHRMDPLTPFPGLDSAWRFGGVRRFKVIISLLIGPMCHLYVQSLDGKEKWFSLLLSFAQLHSTIATAFLCLLPTYRGMKNILGTVHSVLYINLFSLENVHYAVHGYQCV